MRVVSGSAALLRRSLASLSVLSCALLAASCGGSGASGASTESASESGTVVSRTVVAIVDFSSSQTSHAVGEARGYLEKVVNGLDHGDRLVLMEMYRTGSRDSVGVFVQDMPEPMRPGAATSYDRRALEAARRGVLNALPVFFDPELVRSVSTTDLLTTMHFAAEHLRDAEDQEKELLVLSDMLQSTPEFEFEGGRRMPPDAWVPSQESQDLLPSLEGTCVVVIGADHTTPDGQRVLRFWDAYFTSAGASLDPSNYRLRAPTEPVGC